MSLRPTIQASAAGCAACRTSALRLFVSPHAPIFAAPLPLRRRPFTPSTVLLSQSAVVSLRSSRLYSTRDPSRPYRQTAKDNDDLVDPNEWTDTDLKEELSTPQDPARSYRGGAEDNDDTVEPNEWRDTDLEAESVAGRRKEAMEADEVRKLPEGAVRQEEEVEAQTEKSLQADDSQDKPWYLQEEAPRHPTLVPELQPLPDIPKNTPTILSDLVQCLAENMGLDDLSLLDLRTLDPPAALGPSLIMLFGSARSERHLHISAGRLKAWLRQRGHNIHADGLMGRKEFKIQMRRKHRRARLLGTTPSPSESGLTTRWVCMNLGTIGYKATDEMGFSSDDGTLTGFGVRQTGGTTIVVQMFTESKRKEMDLELLWSRILARRTAANSLVEDDLEYAEAKTPSNEVSMWQEGGSAKVLAQPSQRRFFSTSSRRLVAPLDDSIQVTSPPTPNPAPNSVDISLDPVKDLAAKVAELEQLVVSFGELPYPAAVEVLSAAQNGRQSEWIEQWNRAIRYLAPEQSWRFRLWLGVTGRKFGLQSSTLAQLRDLVQEMELLGIISQRSQYIELLQAVYLEHAESTEPLVEQSQLALDILSIMFERGEPIIAADVVVSLIESLARAESQDGQKRELQRVLEKFIHQVDLPYIGEDAVVRLLNAYASQDNWERWWEVWRMAPQHGLPRSEGLYAHMWATMAASQHQRRCREALRSYYVEMVNEQPPVKPVGAVKEALEQCLRVAEPQAEKIAREVVVLDYRTQNLAEAEFVHMWRVLNPHWARMHAS